MITCFTCEFNPFIVSPAVNMNVRSDWYHRLLPFWGKNKDFAHLLRIVPEEEKASKLSPGLCCIIVKMCVKESQKLRIKSLLCRTHCEFSVEIIFEVVSFLLPASGVFCALFKIQHPKTQLSYDLLETVLSSIVWLLRSLRDKIHNANSCELEHLATCLQDAFMIKFPSLSSVIQSGEIGISKECTGVLTSPVTSSRSGCYSISYR